MKKKVIPFGKSVIGYGILFIIIFGVSLYLIIKGNKDWWRYAILTLLILISLYFFLSPVIMYIVYINGDTLSMKKDFGIFAEDRIQYAETVDLKQVKVYKIVLSGKNSRSETYPSKPQKKKYIEFEMQDGAVKRLYVSTLLDKQIVFILNYIKQITGFDAAIE